MRQHLRFVAIGATTIALTMALAACGEAGGGDDGGNEGNGDGGGTIGLLLPEDATTRYESFDRPYIEGKIAELCAECEVKYSNASEDANLQRQQFDALLTEGVDVIILDPVDASATASWVEDAAAEGVPVVAYDRLAQGPIEAYVSYDNERVGQLQGQAVLDSLGAVTDPRVVMINGSPTDPNAALFKSGAHSVLDESAEVVFEQDIDGWQSAVANEEMTAAIDSLGEDGFDAVYVANDGMAAGVITALNAAGITGGVPVGGQDAELAGLQRIVAGEQAFTVYKALKPEAEVTAEIAVRLLRGEEIGDLAPDSVDSPTDSGIPSVLLDPVVVTVDNITDTVIADEFYAAADICTGDYAAACAEAGIG